MKNIIVLIFGLMLISSAAALAVYGADTPAGSQDTTCGSDEWLCPLTNACVEKGVLCYNGLKGGVIDEHGCNPTAGYSWCGEKNKCLRIFEENCTSPGNIGVEQIGGETDEHGCAISAGRFWCEEKQKCVMIHQEDCPSLDNIDGEQIGGEIDEHGCAISAGEIWCVEKNACVMINGDGCPGLEFPGPGDDGSEGPGPGEDGPEGTGTPSAGDLDEQDIGGVTDTHGCRTSAGEIWCVEKNACVMIHGDGCPGIEFPDTDTYSEDPATSVDEAKERVLKRQQEMVQEQEAAEEGQQNALRNQNPVRLAVHALLESENLVGGIGPQVSAIARDFNNSIQATLNAEERIERKSAFARFFTGGDKSAAQELDSLISQNRLRIQQLQQLREQCNCTSEAKAYMLEQIQTMELEQTRLQQLSDGEKQSKGIFGWLWK